MSKKSVKIFGGYQQVASRLPAGCQQIKIKGAGYRWLEGSPPKPCKYYKL